MYWVIDPFKSFSPNQEGCIKSLIILNSGDDSSLDDPTLWKAGKRAFDIFQDYSGQELTLEDLDWIFEKVPKELIDACSEFAGRFNAYIESGLLRVVDSESRQEISSFTTPLDIDPDATNVGFEIEPIFDELDQVFEELSLRMPNEFFPFDRRRAAAYFTILHVDSAAADISLGEVSPDTYYWVKRWFDRLEQYDRIQGVIEERNTRLKSEKSRSMNSARHAKRNKAVELVTSDWNKRKTEFRSAEKAGIFYSDWLRKQGYEYEPRTITVWIRKFAKENGIALR